jgi:hypothetical protein
MHELPHQGDICLELSEAGALARELAAAYRSFVDYHKEQLGLSAQEAVARVESPCSTDYEKQILNGPPDQVHWYSLEYLARKDPELASGRWLEIKANAHDDLRSGHRAARVMEGYSSEPWKRAQFLAIRRDLIEAWKPRDGLESQLIDTMAQAQTAMSFWHERLAIRSSFEPYNEKQDIKERGGYRPPRVSDAQAVDEAATMVDRFNRIYLRTLRALGDLRRCTAPVFVQNAGHVNVAGQQINLTCGGRDTISPEKAKDS